MGMAATYKRTGPRPLSGLQTLIFVLTVACILGIIFIRMGTGGRPVLFAAFVGVLYGLVAAALNGPNPHGPHGMSFRRRIHLDILALAMYTMPLSAAGMGLMAFLVVRSDYGPFAGWWAAALLRGLLALITGALLGAYTSLLLMQLRNSALHWSKARRAGLSAPQALLHMVDTMQEIRREDGMLAFVPGLALGAVIGLLYAVLRFAQAGRAFFVGLAPALLLGAAAGLALVIAIPLFAPAAPARDAGAGSASGE